MSGRKKRRGDLWVVANDHGDRHGFAQRACEAEEYGSQNAQLGVGDNYLPRCLPTGGAQSQRGFALLPRNGQESLARHRYDKGDRHDRQDDAGSEESQSVIWALKQRKESQGRFQERGDVHTHQRDQGEEREQPIDDAGDSRQQLNQNGESVTATGGRQLGKEDGRPQAERNRNDERNGRGNYSAVKKGQGSKFFGNGVPHSGNQETQPGLVPA